MAESKFNEETDAINKVRNLEERANDALIKLAEANQKAEVADEKVKMIQNKCEVEASTAAAKINEA